MGSIEQMLLILSSVPESFVLDHEGILADDWVDRIDDLKISFNEPVSFYLSRHYGNDFGETTGVGP